MTINLMFQSWKNVVKLKTLLTYNKINLSDIISVMKKI